MKGSDFSTSHTVVWRELADYKSGGTYGVQIGSSKVTFQYNDGTNFHSWGTTNTISTNQWYHIAFTFTYGTGSSIKCYVNGQEEAGSWNYGDGNSAPWSGTEDVWIGKRKATSYPQYFHGTIDEVAIYSSALSATEIMAHYKMGKP